MGLPQLRPNDVVKVANGNRTMRATATIIKACLQAQIPVMLENPFHSMLWLAPPIAKLLLHSAAVSTVTDLCGFKAKWRKRTRLVGWFCGNLLDLRRLCTGRGGLCSFSGNHHIVLEGHAPNGPLWTVLAQVYPTNLAQKIASTFISSASESQVHRLLGIGCGL